jgi:hypothetical protein
MTVHLRHQLLLALLLAMPVVGCAGRRTAYPSTESPLALQRVVLYRSGIGYFERNGEIDTDELTLKVRRDQVDDLLKSLTVVDRKSGQALSVSMPLDPESWAGAALATLTPGQGSLAEVLDKLRGTEVVLHTTSGRIRGRIVMVERLVDEPDPDTAKAVRVGIPPMHQPQRDWKVTLIRGDKLSVVRLSKVKDVTLLDGDLAMQLHRRLDASAGEGMFQQVEVAIRLAGAKDHDLAVSYVVAAPMWKPTYRVVLPESGKGKALLQGWAVVDNTSGEDWSEVSMSLTSGEPIAFRYDLHTPRTVDRADLTESGVRRQARVAVGETTWTEPEEPEPVAEAEEQANEGEMDYDDEASADFAEDAKSDKAIASRRKSKKEAEAKPSSATGRASAAPSSGPMGGSAGADPYTRDQPAPPAAAVDLDALRRSTLATARAKQVSGMTRYDLGARVTVPNGTSTMVAILNHEVEAEQTFLYRPGGAGVGFDANPYRVVRFRNSTQFVLEPGPISIYAGGSFVGEGLSEAVGTATSATIPFAVEPTVMVSSTSTHTGDEMHLLRIVRGVLEVESFARTTTTWTAKGQTTEGFTVLVRHPKSGWNYEIKDPPKGTETLPDAYLIPVNVPKGKAEGNTVVLEQTPSKTTISIWDERAIGVLEKLLLAADVTKEMREKLQPVVDLRREIGRIDTQVDGLQRQRIELDQRASETRANLEAIKKDPAASALRKKLSTRLEEFTADGDKLGRQVVELQSQRLEKKIALEDLLQDLDLSAPPRKKTGAKPTPTAAVPAKGSGGAPTPKPAG